jgi:hypothetical protein
MTDPRRLVIDGADDFERTLLQSADGDSPSKSRRASVIAALGVAAATTTTSAGAGAGAATAGATAKVGLAVVLKWIGVATVALAATGAGVHLVRSVPARPPLVASSQAPLPGAQPVASSVSGPASLATAGSLVPPAPLAQEPAGTVSALPNREPAPAVAIASGKPVEPRPEIAPPELVQAPASDSPAHALESTALPSPSDATPSATPSMSSLAEEIPLIDAARRALRGGTPAQSLAILDDYGRRFPGGVLAQEATVERIEALSALGRRGEAARIGRSFLASHPASPLAARVRGMVDSVIDSSRSDD